MPPVVGPLRPRVRTKGTAGPRLFLGNVFRDTRMRLARMLGGTCHNIQNDRLIMAVVTTLDPAKDLLARCRETPANRPVWLFPRCPIGHLASTLASRTRIPPADRTGSRSEEHTSELQ